MNRLYPGKSSVMVCVLFAAAGGCGEAFVNLTASRGGATAGDQGTVRVLVINNTPHRAVFTLGSFDRTDQLSTPDIEQAGLEDGGPSLEGGAISEILSIGCGRVFAIGSAELLRFIDENLPDGEVDKQALVDGVAFFDVPTDDAGISDDPILEGVARPFEALLGVDFPCNGLLILRLEFDDLGTDPFRIDFELILSASTR